MSTPDGRIQTSNLAKTDDPPGAAFEPEQSIIVAANRPDVDPCDVACDAMPGYVVGDLTSPETAWLVEHTADCNYCAGVLGGYKRIGTLLDTLNHYVVPDPPRPRFLQPAAHASYGQVDSPLGPLFVAVTDAGLCEIGFSTTNTEADFRARLKQRGFKPVPDQAAIDRVARQLQEYFGGRRDRFEVQLDFAGVTPFAKDVLTAAAEVPFGHLTTYRNIAERVGRPRATRAVGNALGRNPIPVIVPCHRIIRSDASLGGYTGGVAIKERLLSLEGINPAGTLPLPFSFAKT